MDRPNEKKLKVLFATPYKSGVGGGIAQWAENIMRHYQTQEASGLHIDVLPMGRVANVKITSLVKRAVTGVVEYAGIIRKERQMLKSGQYDVLHLCTSASMSLLKDLVMISLAQKHHVHTVVHFHFGRIPQLRDVVRRPSLSRIHQCGISAQSGGAEGERFCRSAQR